MKLKHLFLGVLATLAIASCQQPQPEVVPEVKVSKAELTAVAAGGDLTVSVTSNVDWSAKSDSDWAVVTPNSGKASNKAQDLTIKVAENTAETAREAKITITAGTASATVKVTQAAKEPVKPEEPEQPTLSEWALVGSFNGWDAKSDLYLTVLDENYFVYNDFDLAEGAEFKFLKGGQRPPAGQEIGGNGLVQPNTIQPAGGSNIKVTAAGRYDIYLTTDLTRFYIMSEGVPPSEATEPAPVENTWGMMGCFVDNQCASDVPMTKEGEWIVAKGAQFTELTFKIRANGSWSDATNIGFAPGSPKGALNSKISVITAADSKANHGGDAVDIKVEGEAGTYDVYFSFEKLEVWVMEEGYEPGETPIKPFDLKDGPYWIMASSEEVLQVMTPLAEDKTYGYPTAVAAEGGVSYASNAFTFTKVEGGYTIQDASARYYYHDPAYATFNAGAELPAEGGVWEVFENINGDGTFAIINTKTEAVIGYSTQHTSYGVYTEDKFDGKVLPMLIPAENAIPDGDPNKLWGIDMTTAINRVGSFTTSLGETMGTMVSIAVHGDNLVVCAGDGTAPILLDKKTGKKVGKLDTGDVVPMAVTNDDAGNLVFTNRVYDYGKSYELFTVYYIKPGTSDVVKLLDIYSSFQYYTSYIGAKVTARGDITTNGVVASAWEGVSGVTGDNMILAFDIVDGVASMQKLTITGITAIAWMAGYWCEAPANYPGFAFLGTNSKDGGLVAAYDENKLYQFSSTGAATLAAAEPLADGNYVPNAFDIRNVEGKPYLAIAGGCHFPEYGIAPLLRIVDLSTQQVVASPTTTNYATTDGVTYSAGVGASAGVIIEPVSGGYNVYYVDNNCSAIEAFHYDVK